MAQFVVTSPDGRKFKVNAPDGTTRMEIESYVRSQMGFTPQDDEEDDGPGFVGAIGNAFARMGGRARGLVDAYQAEQFATIADGQEKQAQIDAERAETGEQPGLLEKILTYRPSFAQPLETTDELRGLAAENIQQQALRNQDFALRYPMSAGGQRGAGIVGQETWGDVAKFALDNPLDVLSFAGQVGVEQAPSLGAAIVGTAVTKNPYVGMGIMGSSTYAQERFGQMSEAAQKFGYDLTKPEDAKKAANDEAFLAEQESRGFKRGAVIAAIDAITLGLGSKLPMTKMGLAGNFGLQVAGGSTGEATGQLLTEGEITSPGDVFVEGLAEGVTLPLEVGIMVAGNRSGADVDVESANVSAQEEVELLRQQEAELEAQRLAEEENQKLVGLSRVQAAREFVPFKQFQTQKSQEQIADVLKSDDFLNWVANTRTADRPYPQTDKEFEREAKAYIKETTPEGASQALFEEYNALLDEHTEFRAEQAQRTPKAQEQADKLITDLLQQRAEARAAGDADAEAKVEATAASMLTAGEWRFAKFKADGVIKDKAPKKETPKKPVAPEAGVQPNVQTNLMEDPEVQTEVGEGFGAQENVDKTPEPPAAVDPMTMPVRRRTDALKQLDALVEDGSLPPNWVDENVDLNSAVNGQRFNIKKYKEALENTLNPVEETDVANEEDAEVEPVNVEEITKMEGFSEDQQKVYDVLVDHFVGDKKFEQDEVYAGGQFQATKIAELAGVETKQAVSTTINRFRDKFLEEQGRLEKGATKKQKDEAFAKFAEALNAQQKPTDTAAQPEQASDELIDNQDAVDQQADADEVTDDDAASNSIFQQQGMGTVASVGQGNFSVTDETGRTSTLAPEDIEYTQARAEEKDEYANKRQELADRERRIQRVRLVKAYGQTAMNLWRNMATDGAAQPEQLSTEDLMDWIGSVQEFEEGAIDENTLSQDQREIEQRYENEATTETREETDDAGQDTGADESAEGRDKTEQVGASDTRTGGAATVYSAAREVNNSNQKPVPTTKKFSLKTPTDTSGDVETVAETIRFKADQLFGTRGLTSDTGKQIEILQADSPNSIIQVHKTPKDAVRQLGGSMTLEEVQNAKAFIDPRNNSQAHFIASNIAPNEAEGVLLHDVGVHLGLEAQLKPEEFSSLVDAVRDWENSEAGSIENEVYQKTIARVAFARATGMDASLTDIEFLGYAVEESVNAGITLDPATSAADATSSVRKWLADVANYFSMLMKRWSTRGKVEKETGERFDIVSAEELVALTRGAGYIANDTVIVEAGSNTNDQRELMGFYVGEDRGRRLEEDATILMRNTSAETRERVLNRNYDPQTQTAEDMEENSEEVFIPGEEVFRWGENSKFGPYSDIFTEAKVYADQNQISMDLLVYSNEIEEANGRSGTPITVVSLTEMFSNAYSLTVYGPQNFGSQESQAVNQKKVSDVTDIDGDQWSRLEGVTHSQNMRLFTEARRRLTRVTGGIVPNIAFHRVTGAAAQNTEEGRMGRMLSEEIRKRFSMNMPPEEKSRVQDALGKVVGGKANAAQLTANVQQAYQTPLSALKPLSRVVRDNKEAMPAANKLQEALYLQEQTVQEELLKVEPILQDARKLTPQVYAQTMDFVSNSTFYQKWGYDPEIEGKEVKVDPIMKRAFDKLPPEAQSIAKRMFAYGDEIRKTMNAEAEAKGVKGLFTNSKLEGPYSPLKRFGNFVTVLRSQELLDVQEELQKTPNDKQLEKKQEDLMRQQKHYVVSFFDTKGEAVKFKEQNKANYASGPRGAYTSAKQVGEFENRASNPEVFASVMAAIGADDKSGLDVDTRKNVEKIVERLYLENLDEQSARLSGARRMNRAGFEKDMLRSFISHAQSQARLLGQLRYGSEISQALREVKTEARGNPEELQDVANILQRKYNNLLTRDDRLAAAIQDNITAFNSMYMLTTNVAYHVANATQPAISQAKLAGDFNSYSGALAEVNRGYKEAMKVVDSSLLKQLGTVTTVGMVNMGNTVNLKVENAKPEYQSLLKKMQLRQLLDVGLEQDLNMEVMFDTGYKWANTATEGFKNMSHRLYQSSRYVEAYNRVAVAVAALNMARKNPSVMRELKMTPEEYAIALVEDTQGNYSAIDAPLIIDSLPKVTTQFRKFQLIMGWLWGTTARAALPFVGAKSKYERAAARRTLMYLGANVASLAGVKGLPFVNLVGGVALMFFGDDGEEEPKDLERWMREEYGDNALVDVLTKGAPALVGIDLSAKLQQRDIYMPLNIDYIDTSPDAEVSKNIAYNLVFGPTAGTIGNLDRAIEHYRKGNLSKAVEYILPKGQRSALESLRFAQEGYTLKNNDVILDPRSFDMMELVKNTLGLTPLELSKLKWTYGQQIELKNHFADQQAQVKRDYLKAYQNRDRERLSELRQEWRDLQKQKDRVRPFFKNRDFLKRSPITNLLTHPRNQRRREQKQRRLLGVD